MRDIFNKNIGKEKRMLKFLSVFLLSLFLFQSLVSTSGVGVRVKESHTKFFTPVVKKASRVLNTL